MKTYKEFMRDHSKIEEARAIKTVSYRDFVIAEIRKRIAKNPDIGESSTRYMFNKIGKDYRVWARYLKQLPDLSERTVYEIGLGVIFRGGKPFMVPQELESAEHLSKKSVGDIQGVMTPEYWDRRMQLSKGNMWAWEMYSELPEYAGRL